MTELSSEKQRKIQNSFVFRKAGPEDLDGICDLEKICFPQEPWSRQMFSEELENDLALFVIAEDAAAETVLDKVCDAAGDRGKTAGYIIAWVIAPAECQIGSIAVLPEYRRSGIASELMGILIDVCRQTGTPEVYLEVRVSNRPAIRLYESFGFRIDGLRKHYYQDGEDAYTMGLAVSLKERTDGVSCGDIQTERVSS